VEIGDVARSMPGCGEHSKFAGNQIAVPDERVGSYRARRSFFEKASEQHERAEFRDSFAQPRAETVRSVFTSEKRSVLGCVMNGDAQASFQFCGTRGVVVVPMGQKHGG